AAAGLARRLGRPLGLGAGGAAAVDPRLEGAEHALPDERALVGVVGAVDAAPDHDLVERLDLDPRLAGAEDEVDLLAGLERRVERPHALENRPPREQGREGVVVAGSAGGLAVGGGELGRRPARELGRVLDIGLDEELLAPENPTRARVGAQVLDLTRQAL